MGKVFGISKLLVSKPFPSLEFGRMNEVPAPFSSEISKAQVDTFVKKANENTIKIKLAKFFRSKHTKV